MLISKESESGEAATTATWVTPEPKSQAALLPESTNDELLAELQGMVTARLSTRKGILASYLGGIVLYAVSMFAFISTFFSSARSMGLLPLLFALLASLCFIVLGMYGSLRLGRGFYKRRRERLRTVIPALAERGEARLLPLLLELMDQRYSGVLMWKESRSVFLHSLETLLTRITPEQFQSLSRQQIWDTVTMLYYPDGRLREVTVEAVVRCGDYRTMESLKQLRLLCSVGPTSSKSLFYRLNPMVRFLQKEGVPLPTEETRDAIERAIIGLTAQEEEMRRAAQLLRPSGRDHVPDGKELVRAATSPGAATASEQLVRPADSAPGP